MTNITLGQVAAVIAFLVALFTGVSYLVKQFKEFIIKALKDQFDPINKKIDELDKKVSNVDIESCKNFLVQFLSAVDQGDRIDEIQKERFWEEYQHYIKIGGNTYIKKKVDQLEREGRL